MYLQGVICSKMVLLKNIFERKVNIHVYLGSKPLYLFTWKMASFTFSKLYFAYKVHLVPLKVKTHKLDLSQ